MAQIELIAENIDKIKVTFKFLTLAHLAPVKMIKFCYKVQSFDRFK